MAARRHRRPLRLGARPRPARETVPSVIASEAKQSRNLATGKDWIASEQSLLAMTVQAYSVFKQPGGQTLTFSPRHRPSFARTSPSN